MEGFSEKVILDFRIEPDDSTTRKVVVIVHSSERQSADAKQQTC